MEARQEQLAASRMIARGTRAIQYGRWGCRKAKKTSQMPSAKWIGRSWPAWKQPNYRSWSRTSSICTSAGPREIGLTDAEGLTTYAIAKRLRMSRRNVERTLTKALGKVAGAARRMGFDLAEAFDYYAISLDDGLPPPGDIETESPPWGDE